MDTTMKTKHIIYWPNFTGRKRSAGLDVQPVKYSSGNQHTFS